jgi:hypothetical protein
MPGFVPVFPAFSILVSVRACRTIVVAEKNTPGVLQTGD